jgi:hypothetical protein
MEAVVFSETSVLSAKSQNITNVLEFLRTPKRSSKRSKVRGQCGHPVGGPCCTSIDVSRCKWHFKLFLELESSGYFYKFQPFCHHVTCCVLRVNKSFCPPHGAHGFACGLSWFVPLERVPRLWWVGGKGMYWDHRDSYSSSTLDGGEWPTLRPGRFTVEKVPR